MSEMERDGSERSVGKGEEQGRGWENLNKEVNKGEKEKMEEKQQPQYAKEFCSFWMKIEFASCHRPTITV